MNVELSSSGAAYVRYSIEKSVGNVYVGEDESADVIADVDAQGKIVGIEIVDTAEADDIALAQTFARERGLPFPRDLAAAVRDIAAA